jgi:D-sedoheptulose 7-phosphate isomerase
VDVDRVGRSLAGTLDVLAKLREEVAPAIAEVSRVLIERVRAGGKILICGNGGSAADAQHMATELTVCYLVRDRRPLPAIALTVDTSVLTAAANDLGFEHVFSRQVEALGRAGDALIAISTSGNSPNVLRAVEQGREQGIVTIGLTGKKGGALADKVDHWLGVPSDDTPRIQEAHLVVEHLLCEALEEALGARES